MLTQHEVPLPGTSCLLSARAVEQATVRLVGHNAVRAMSLEHNRRRAITGNRPESSSIAPEECRRRSLWPPEKQEYAQRATSQSPSEATTYREWMWPRAQMDQRRQKLAISQRRQPSPDEMSGETYPRDAAQL